MKVPNKYLDKRLVTYVINETLEAAMLNSIINEIKGFFCN